MKEKSDSKKSKEGSVHIGDIGGASGTQIYIGKHKAREEREDGEVFVTGSGSYVGGDVTMGGGVFIGRDQSTVAQVLGAQDELDRLFSDIYIRIESRPDDPSVDKQEIKEALSRIEMEAKKGDASDASKIERWLRILGIMSPDIFDLTISSLANPVISGSNATIYKLACRLMEGGQAG